MQKVWFTKVTRATMAMLLGGVLGLVLAHTLASVNSETTFAQAKENSPSTEAQGLTPRVWLPLIMRNYPPPHPSLSRYMTDTVWSTLNNAGCKEGQNTPEGQDVIVTLDFGQPWYNGTNYGTLVFNTLQFRSTDQISRSVQGYLSGFYYCAPTNAHLALVVGSSNFGSGVSREHGVAWAQMVNNLNAWISSPPSYASKVTARGGSDIELDTAHGWRDPVTTRAWVDGYNSAFVGPSHYYNYGSCDSCPYRACPSCVPLGGWSVDDIWYVSYGAPAAYPLPEIYRTDGVQADQWYRMSLYGYTNHGFRININGALTQWLACQDRPAANCHARGIDNTPAMGWGQMLDALNADSRTAQPVQWSTDITWQQQ